MLLRTVLLSSEYLKKVVIQQSRLNMVSVLFIWLFLLNLKEEELILTSLAGGFDKTICLRKMSVQTIEEKFDLLKNSSGKKLKKTKDVVTSMNPSVRGIWSPLHVHPSQRFKI